MSSAPFGEALLAGLRACLGEIGAFCTAHQGDAALAPHMAALARHAEEWQALTRHVGEAAMKNPEEVGAAAVDYLGTNAWVDRERIGVIGVCGSGGFSLAAAQIDPRVSSEPCVDRRGVLAGRFE